MRNNQNGWVLLSLTIVLPMLLSSAVLTAWAVWFGYRKQQTESLCQKHLLKAQKALVDATNDLLDLNPDALALIQERIYWKNLLKVTPGPFKAAVAARLAITLAKQKALAIRQKMIINQGRVRSTTTLSSLRIKMLNQLKSMNRSWGGDFSFPVLKFRYLSPKVIPTSTEIAPMYRRIFNYKSVQELKFTWRVQLNKNSPYPWLEPFIKTRWSSQCHSHPRRKGVQWYAHLGKARF